METLDFKEAVERLLAAHGTVTNRSLVEATGLSRQAVHLHLREWEKAGDLVAVGAGRSRRYRGPNEVRRHVVRYKREGLSESEVFAELEMRWLGADCPEPMREVLRYAFTAMLDDAINHSGSAQLEVAFGREPGRWWFEVLDSGAGVFTAIRQAKGFGSDLEALQELSKGKLTTQPERHSGEGIFFVSRAADRFELESGRLRWVVDNVRPDQAAFDVEPARAGTRVRFEAGLPLRRTLRAVFATHTHEFQFAKTDAVVKLFEKGTSFVSRAEAKKLARGLERFREVVLDFRGVQGVGQGFVDELFRVWANAHPEVKLEPVNMGEAVEFMVRRGLAGR